MSSQKHHAKSNKRPKGRAGHAPHGYKGVRASKALGQNFLIDENTIEKIVQGSGADADTLVIEIGPGTGALTLPLAERSGYLIAVELDERLIEPLRIKTFGMDNVEILHEDILELDLDSLIEANKSERGLSRVAVVGNLPYYITTPIIMKLLESVHGLDCISVMMQKEVGDRIAAEPGDRAAGAITYSVHYYAEVSEIADAPREFFYPAPNVDSVVLRLDVREHPAVEVRDPDYMFKCIRAGFSQRRKTLLNSLSVMEDTDKEKISAALERAGIDQTRRAETLTLAEFARLADCMQEE